MKPVLARFGTALPGPPSSLNAMRVCVLATTRTETRDDLTDDREGKCSSALASTVHKQQRAPVTMTEVLHPLRITVERMLGREAPTRIRMALR